MTDPIHFASMQTALLTGGFSSNRGAAAGIQPSHSGGTGAKVAQAAGELESLFIQHLLKEMRASIPKSELFGGGKAEEMYTGMLDEHLARKLADAGGIGISKPLLAQMQNLTAGIKGKTD
jgi:Rod binding domain-containing protein